MKGCYQVAGYEGNVYYRFIPENSTTVYSDEHIARFDSENEAKAFVLSIEEQYSYEYESQFSYSYENAEE